eukprot:366202-Chlamydomonas_euryale.AAC.4
MRVVCAVALHCIAGQRAAHWLASAGVFWRGHGRAAGICLPPSLPVPQACRQAGKRQIQALPCHGRPALPCHGRAVGRDRYKHAPQRALEPWQRSDGGVAQRFFHNLGTPRPGCQLAVETDNDVGRGEHERSACMCKFEVDTLCLAISGSVFRHKTRLGFFRDPSFVFSRNPI